MPEPNPRDLTIERLPAVLARTGLGRSTLYALVAEARFPAPLKLSTRAVGWRRADVDTWLLDRLSAR